MHMMQYFSLWRNWKNLKMIRKKFVLTDLNHLGATHFSTLRDPYLGRDPYFGNRCPKSVVPKLGVYNPMGVICDSSGGNAETKSQCSSVLWAITAEETSELKCESFLLRVIRHNRYLDLGMVRISLGTTGLDEDDQDTPASSTRFKMEG